MTRDVDSEPHFQALENGVVLIQECSACGNLQFPPRAICLRCGETPSWREIEGTGTIYSVTTSYRPGTEWLANRVPYSVALIDLDERVRMLARISGALLDHTAIGSRVRAQVIADPRGQPAIEFALDRTGKMT